MIEVIYDILKILLLGVLVTLVVMLFFVIMLSLPEIFERMSYWIGEICTWIIFIFIIVSIVVIGIGKGR